MTQKTLDYYLNLPYPMVITPDDEGFGVEFPDLPRCFTHAKKWEDIQEMAREATTLWLTVMLQDRKPIPEPAPQAL